MSYKKPTLIEQYLEFSFKKDTISQSMMFDIVPLIKGIDLDNIEITNIDQALLLEGQIQKASIPRFRCWSKDRNSLVQLSPDQVIINKVGKYLGWTDFSELYTKTLVALEPKVKINDIQAVTFTTIDLFQEPMHNFLIDKFLNCNGAIIPQWYNNVKEPIDIAIGKGFLPNDGYNKQIKIAGRKLNEEYQIHITSLFQKKVNISNVESLKKEIEELHDDSNYTFEAMITEYLRENILGGQL
jgi:uncharacterized protein (TIGR04255 family)